MGKAAPQLPVCPHGDDRPQMGGREENGGKTPPPATFDGDFGYQEVPFDLTIVIVPLVRDKSGRISKHVFRDKLSKL